MERMVDNMKKVPKYIKDKCRRMAKLCSEAYLLKMQTESEESDPIRVTFCFLEKNSIRGIL